MEVQSWAAEEKAAMRKNAQCVGPDAIETFSLSLLLYSKSRLSL
jgi:hypothetical protein